MSEGYTFSELTELCNEIRSRIEDGSWPPEIEGCSVKQVDELLIAMQEAGMALQRASYNLMSGGRIALRIRSDEEMYEIERRERFERLTNKPVQRPTATADDLGDLLIE